MCIEIGNFNPNLVLSWWQDSLVNDLAEGLWNLADLLYGYLGPQLREFVHGKGIEGGGPWN